MSGAFDKPRVVEAEVVHEHDEPTSIQHVEVEQVRPGAQAFAHELFQGGADPTGLKQKVKQIRARLWAATAFMILLAAVCFVGVFMTEVVPLAALLLVLGVLFALIAAALGFVVRGMRRLGFPSNFADMMKHNDNKS